MKPTLLIAVEVPPELLAELAANFDTVYAPGPAALREAIAADGANARAVLTNGSFGLSAQAIAALPMLEIICCRGAGHENVDLEAAGARRIVVTHGPQTNDAAVADHAMALLFAVVRGIPAADARVRAGGWGMLRAPRPELSGKRLGIIGLGHIGSRIARRAVGFDMSVHYHNRSRRDDLPYQYLGSAAGLAAAVDFLIVVCPGGPGTRHLVDATVLAALGEHGFVVNVGRGSVIDTAALVDALLHRRIAGAALDVFEGEPGVPAALLPLPNLVLTPHIAGRSPEAVAASGRLVLSNLGAHFSGQAVLTPVPGFSGAQGRHATG